MTIIRCPRCRDEVTAPAKASRLAIVRCPLCLEEYPLADALRQVPPELIIVGADAEAAADLDANPWHAAESAGTAAATEGAGVFDAGPGAGVAAPAARPVVKGPRPKRRERSAIGQFFGVVFGGLGGIAMGLLVLWWVFKQDVGVGPSVAKYAPWIVPAQFHGKTESAVNTAGGGKTAAATPASNGPRKSKGGGAPKKSGDGEGPMAALPEPGSLPELGSTSPLSPASANVDLPSLDLPMPPA